MSGGPKFSKAAGAAFGAKSIVGVDLIPPGAGWVLHFFAHDLRVNQPFTPSPEATPDNEPAGFVHIMKVTVFQPDEAEGIEVPQKDGIVPRFVLARLWPDLRIAHYQLDGDGSVNLH